MFKSFFSSVRTKFSRFIEVASDFIGDIAKCFLETWVFNWDVRSCFSKFVVALAIVSTVIDGGLTAGIVYTVYILLFGTFITYALTSMFGMLPSQYRKREERVKNCFREENTANDNVTNINPETVTG